jgi:hypothetical protein
MPGCKFCENILIGFMIEHDEKQCPLKASLHCSHCASYGHSKNACPNRVLSTDGVKYLEQLIPQSEIIERNITSRTPLPKKTKVTGTTSTRTSHSIPVYEFTTEPIYLEQLIPYHERIERNITSRTPLPKRVTPKQPEILEIRNTDYDIYLFLINRGITQAERRKDKAKDNRQLLVEYAETNNMKLVFV